MATPLFVAYLGELVLRVYHEQARLATGTITNNDKLFTDLWLIACKIIIGNVSVSWYAQTMLVPCEQGHERCSWTSILPFKGAGSGIFGRGGKESA